MKGPNQVFAGGNINSGFAAYRRIDLRQQRCGDLHHVDAAQIGRRGKAGQVAYYAAALRNHEVFAGKLDLRHLVI